MTQTPSEHPRTARAFKRVQAEWAARVVAEYRSASLTAELLHWLIQLGVSPDTIAVCHRIVSDELTHAELSRAVYDAAGGGLAPVEISAEQMSIAHEPGESLPFRALAVAADVFCCNETVALPLFQEMRRGATETTARAALDRIVLDEAVHRAFGWSLLDELRAVIGPTALKFVRDRTESYVAHIRHVYRSVPDAVTDQQRAWGLIDAPTFGRITEECISEVIEPRFATFTGMQP